MKKVGNIYQGGGGLKKVGNIRTGFTQPQIQQPQIQQPQGYPDNSWQGIVKNTITGIPNAIGQIGNQIKTNPLDTLKSIGSGVYKGIEPLIKLQQYTNPASLIPQVREAQKKSSELLGGYKPQNEVSQSIQSGFEQGGAMVPYMLGGEVAGATKLAQASPRLAQYLGFAGTSQLLSDKKITDVKGRAEQAALDTLLFGLTNLGGKALRKGELPKQTLPEARTGQGIPAQALPETQFQSEQGSPQTNLKKLVESSYNPIQAPNVKSVNPLQEGGKTRGFAKSIDASSETSMRLTKNVLESPESLYKVKENQSAMRRAVNRITNNIDEAERFAKNYSNDEAVFTANELIKHYDGLAQKAKVNGDEATFDVAMNKATDIAINQMKRGTEAGRAVQAFSTIDKMSPEGTLNFINKTIQDAGSDFKLSNQEYYDFMRRAEQLKNIADPKERALANFDLMDDIYSKVPVSTKDKIYESLNIPRALMATADLSAPFRQGIFVAARHPITFFKNIGKMFKYAGSEKAFNNLRADIVTSPNYELYIKHKLPLTGFDGGLTGREERFMSSWADKIPGIGKITSASNRAYTGFLNKLRVDLFDDFVNTAKLNKITDPKMLDDAANFVGAATGRGRLGRFEDAAKLLNTTFFSPRLMASRFSLINPLYYSKLSPAVRKEAIKSLAAFVGTGTSVLALSKMAGADVGADPRSADFGKIKIGNTRMDIWGGFQQYARLIGQLVSGEKISTITGKQTTLGQGYGAPTLESIAMDFFKSKESPILSFITRLAKGNQYGQEPNIPAEVVNRFIPMVLSDAFDLYKDKGLAGEALAVPGIFGVGLQTYGDQVPKVGQTPSGAPNIQWMQEPGLGETIVNKISGNEFSNIPEDLRTQLYQEKQQESLRQIDVDSAKARVLETGKSERVGDTFIYLQNGIVKTKKLGNTSRTPVKDQLLYQELQKRKTNPFYQ